MPTEDDTYNKLIRISYDDLKVWLDLTMKLGIPDKNRFDGTGWTLNEYYLEMYKHIDNYD